MKPLLALAAPLAAALAAALPGCTTAQNNAAARPALAAAASDADRAALLDRVKGLEGEWLMKDESGQMVPGAIFKVSSGGSAVREIMFPGSDHEMTNIYHMDGRSLVMTHYCAAGNQPRMRAAASAGPVIDLRFDSVTNWDGSGDHFMGGMKLTLVDADHIRQDWTSYDRDGKPAGNVVFDLTRKK